MAVTKIRKFSSWTLLIIMIATVLVLGAFYFWGAEDPAAEQKVPKQLDVLLSWIYGVVIISIAALLIFGLMQFANTLKAKPKAALGSLVVLVGFAALLGISYSIGDTTPLANINSDSAHFNTDFWLKISDMWIYSIYVLMGLCVLAIIASSFKNILKR
ncbi:MAG: hypothetical protein LBR50_11080 [Tannerella sp.]|jgi:hypothetical protein|nr:hypothetical protein [Tannerella sp.]